MVVGNVVPTLNFAENPGWDGVSFRDWGVDLKTNNAGEVTATRLAAMFPKSTVSFMRAHTGLPSSQLEISRSLRLMPSDAYLRPDPSAERYGVYLGYQLCRMAAEG